MRGPNDLFISDHKDSGEANAGSNDPSQDLADAVADPDIFRAMRRLSLRVAALEARAQDAIRLETIALMIDH
jgi:hypothetical protein